MSELLLPEDIGRIAMIEKVAAAVQRRDGPGRDHRPGRRPLRADQDPAADHRHHPRRQAPRPRHVWTEHTHDSMDLSNGTTALGIAVALGEIEMPTDADVMRDRVAVLLGRLLLLRASSWTRRRSSSSATPAGIGGRYRIGHSRDEGRPGRGRHLGRHPDAGLDLPERPHPATSTAGWSTSSSSARPARTARSAAGATPCSTTPTCTGTARSRRRSAA